MPSSYTPSLRLVLPVTGELLGAWGDTVNNGLTLLAEDAIAGSADVAMPDANVTLTTNNELPDQARRMFINLTGTLTATRDVICPAVSKLYFVHNAATQAVVFKTSAGTGVTVPVDSRIVLYCDGTNVVPAVNDLPAAAKAGGVALVTVSGTQTLTNKTIAFGSNTLTDVASTNTAQTLTNKTLTSPTINGGTITGITDLAVADGGTGASTPAQAKINLEVITGATGSSRVPAGTEVQRDAAPTAGFFRFNIDINKFEGYNGTDWGSVGGGATGGGADEVFVQNDQIVTTSYAIPSGKNALSTGPITVDSGAVVTIPTGSRWLVL
jgi:hypothetical protein